MIDLHTHILPRMDDGSQSAEESIRLLHMEAQQGVTHVVLTPHFYPTREAPDSFLRRRQESAELLKSAMVGQPGLPKLYLGAEVAYYDGLSRSEAAEQLCIEGTRAMLLEMPFCEWNQRMLGEVYELHSQRRIQPILAHVERYLSFQRSDVITDLCDHGIWIQVNASLFLRWQTARRGLNMLKRHEIHFIGSDCHNLTSRKPNMGEAAAKIERKLGHDAQRYLRHMQGLLLGE